MKSDLFSQAARSQRQRAMVVLIFTSLLSRITVIFMASGNLELALQSGNAAAGQIRLFPPLWGYLAVPLAWMARLTGLAPMIFYKLPVMIADSGIAVLLFMMLSRLAPDGPLRVEEKTPPFWAGGSFWMGLVWAAHPLVILLGAAVGHNESVALFVVLLAAWYVEFSDHPRSDFFAGLALSVALSIKLWPLMMLPLFLKTYVSRRDSWRFAGIALALPSVLILPLFFHAVVSGNPLGHILAMVSSKSEMGLVFGLKDLDLLKSFNPVWMGLLFIVPLGCLYLFGKWKFPLLPGMALAALLLLVAPHSLGVQALLFPLPFALMVPGGLALRLSLVGLGIALLHFGLNDPGAIFIQERFYVPRVPGWFTVAWELMNIGLWIYWIQETWKLLKMCLKPARLRFR